MHLPSGTRMMSPHRQIGGHEGCLSACPAGGDIGHVTTCVVGVAAEPGALGCVLPRVQHASNCKRQVTPASRCKLSNWVSTVWRALEGQVGGISNS